jgi:protein SCO1/2
VENKNNSRAVWAATIVVAVVAVGVIAVALVSRSGQSSVTPTPEEPFTGVETLDPPRPVQEFTLTNQDGDPFSLSDLHGKSVLMFFGYTHCPDVCPLTLLEYKQVKTALGEQADDVAFVFISVDGERDTPERLAEYVSGFDPSFIGLTGDEATLTRMGTDFDLYFAKRPDPSGSAENYLVDHTSSSFLLDGEGRLAAIYPYGTDAAVMAADVAGRL